MPTRFNMRGTFNTDRPIIAMVHLQGEDQKQAIDSALRDADKLARGGVDGLLVENWGLGDSILRDTMEAVVRRAFSDTELPVGVNVLPFEYKVSFEIARVAPVSFVQIDTLVDNLTSPYSSKLYYVNHGEVMAERDNGAQNVAIFANIQTKHYTTIPVSKPLAESATGAVAAGADAIVVTGRWTGQETPEERIHAAREAVGANFPILVGSGLNADNVRRLLPPSDGAIVGTSLKVDGITENPVDLDRVERLMRLVEEIRR